MIKATNKNDNRDYENMSVQKPGSALYIKSHEDFNNQHPEHDENDLKNGNITPVKKIEEQQQTNIG